MLATLVAERLRVVGFHFGLPSAERVRALKDAGIILFASATSLAEARQAESVAQRTSLPSVCGAQTALVGPPPTRQQTADVIMIGFRRM